MRGRDIACAGSERWGASRKDIQPDLQTYLEYASWECHLIGFRRVVGIDL